MLSDFSEAALEVISKEGQGPGGPLHKVKDMRTGTVLARKKIVISAGRDPMNQLLRELDIIRSYPHPNIILFSGAYIVNSYARSYGTEVGLLLEYCSGKSLKAIGERMAEHNGWVEETVVGRLAEGVLQGLAFLVSKEVTHSGIQPSNLLLSREGVIKLSEFGVSHELLGAWVSAGVYMAPERLIGKEHTILSDVWSTGITLLEFVQRRYPLPPNLSVLEMIIHIVQKEPPQLEDEPEGSCFWNVDMKDFFRQILIRDESARPTPRDLLMHPWILGVMKQEVDMARWIQQIWGFS